MLRFENFFRRYLANGVLYSYERQTRSRARSRPFGIERSDREIRLSNKTALAMIFKLAQAAEKSCIVCVVTISCQKSSSV